MKCPACQSENPDSKRFCGDCGTSLRETQTSQWQPGIIHPKRRGKGALIVAAAIAVTTIVVFVSVFAYVLTKAASPEEVFEGWIDCLNHGDARGAADLTIYSEMDLESYLNEVDRLEEGIRHLGTDKIVLNFVEEIPREEEIGEEWSSGLTYMKSWLEDSFGITVEDHVGVYFSLISYSDGVAVPWIDSMPVFRAGNSWYLAYGLWYP